MTLKFNCPGCQAPLSVAAELAGRKARCRKCNQPIVIPAANEVRPAAPTASAGSKQAASEPANQAVTQWSTASRAGQSDVEARAADESQHKATASGQPSRATVSNARQDTAGVDRRVSDTDAALVGESVLAAIRGPIEPVSSTWTYQFALLAVSIVMVLLPILYCGLIVLLGWATVIYTQTAHQFMLSGSSKNIWVWLLVAAPSVGGTIAIFFMIKPILARPGKRPTSRSLEPHQEPLLFAYIEKLCRSVHAPVPVRIDINPDVNASASLRLGWLSTLRRSDLVLTIGMPLVSGLTLRELSGVLAHEFGHFSQGMGMRLSYIVRSIQYWFARVVYERDAWDERLARWASRTDVRIAVVLQFARLMVWLTRKILWLFLATANAISCFLLQMEFDADLHEIRLAGSQAFVATSRKLRQLGLARHQVLSELEEFMVDGKLVNNLPEMIFRRARDNEAVWQPVIALMQAEEKPRWFATHPIDRLRIGAAEKLALAGQFESDAPARVLFQDYVRHCREVTRDFYVETLEDRFQDHMLADVEHMESFQDAARQARDAQARLFGRYFNRPSPIVPRAIDRRDLVESDLVYALTDARTEMIRLLPAYEQSCQTLDELDTRWLETTQALAAARAWWKVTPKQFPNLPCHSLESLEKHDQQLREQLGQLHGQLKPFEQQFVRRLDAAVQWLQLAKPERLPTDPLTSLDQLQRIASCMQAQTRTTSLYNGLRAELMTLVMLANLGSSGQPSQRLVNQLEESFVRLSELLGRFRSEFVGVAYPYEHADGVIDMATYLLPLEVAADDQSALIDAANCCFAHFHYAYFRNLGSLCSVIERVESALGWPQQTDPSDGTPRTGEPAASNPACLAQPAVRSPVPLVASTAQVSLPAGQQPLNSSVPYPEMPAPVGLPARTSNAKWFWIAGLGCGIPMVLGVVGLAVLVGFGIVATKRHQARLSSPIVNIPPPPVSQSPRKRSLGERKLYYRFPEDREYTYSIRIVDDGQADRACVDGTITIGAYRPTKREPDSVSSTTSSRRLTYQTDLTYIPPSLRGHRRRESSSWEFEPTMRQRFLRLQPEMVLYYGIASVSSLIFPPLDPDDDLQWESKTNTSIILPRRAAADDISIPEDASPGAAHLLARVQALREAPTPVRQTLSFEQIDEEDSVLVIKTNSTLQTLGNDHPPRLVVTSTGKWRFSTIDGMTLSRDERFTITLADEFQKKLRLKVERLDAQPPAE